MHRSRRPMQAIAALAVQLTVMLPLQAAVAAPAPETGEAPFSRADFVDVGSPLDFECSAIECNAGVPRHRLRFPSARAFGGALIDIGAHARTGSPGRPRYALGIRSHQLEAALKEIGLEARRCLAPLMRMRTKLSSGFQLSGSLWVYLRCSVN